MRFRIGCYVVVLLGILPTLPTTESFGQDAKRPVILTTQEDHQDMMRQLGITKLRPGPSGNNQAPNAANYDEALANPYPDLPNVMTLKNGENALILPFDDFKGIVPKTLYRLEIVNSKGRRYFLPFIRVAN